ncbi:MAG TPA: DUF2911 domain-containing protein [Longimicrobiaceae bacterium]|nr:DUF2911 domain-containing protein [Longimicrobiaceae bacterium]
MPIRRLAFALLLVSAAAPAQAQVPADSGALVTVLGNDTLALERWIVRPGEIVAEVVVRAPRTTFRRYRMEIAPGGPMRRFSEETFDPTAADGRPLRVEVFEAAEGGWRRTVTEADSTRTAQVQAPATALPFVDLVHWPFEVAVQRLAADSATQPLLSGGRAQPFTLERTAPGEVTITHPNRGPSVARVDAAGRLLSLDAAQTTRKVRVSRVAWMELESVGRRWAEADRAGRGVGELSGRAQAEATVAGARLKLDYGTPSKRGRDIFGTVVPWGQVWRTGANRATHFSTDRPLVLGDPSGGTLVVPAGEYTLFSVPEADGGWLIVNRQTGQNGTGYDAARDLGRVRMRRGDAAETVERFTIRVEPRGAGGVLVLAWDRAEFTVPFTVAP